MVTFSGIVSERKLGSMTLCGQSRVAKMSHCSRGSGPWVWNGLVEHKRACEAAFEAVYLRWGWIARGYGTVSDWRRSDVEWIRSL